MSARLSDRQRHSARLFRAWIAYQADIRRGELELRKLGLYNRPRSRATLMQARAQGFSVWASVLAVVVSHAARRASS